MINLSCPLFTHATIPRPDYFIIAFLSLFYLRNVILQKPNLRYPCIFCLICKGMRAPLISPLQPSWLRLHHSETITLEQTLPFLPSLKVNEFASETIFTAHAFLIALVMSQSFYR